MPNTTRFSLPYPDGTDAGGTGDVAIKNLAEMLDTKLDIAQVGNTRVMRNIIMYEESGPNLAGYIILNTKIPWTDNMCTIRIRGYQYAAYNNIIDMTISFYAYQADGNIYNAEFNNYGSMPVKEALILQRTSDSCVAIAIKPDSLNQYWHYPKLVVEGMFGGGGITDAVLKTGWTMVRAATLTGYTTKKTLLATWTDLPLTNSWVHYDARRAQYIRDADGWVHWRGIMRSGAVNPSVCFVLPSGAIPENRVPMDHHIIVASDGGWGTLRIGGNGNVDYQGTTGYVDLSSVHYKAGPA